MEQQLAPDELILLATAIALILSKNKTADELNVLGNLVVAIGSLLLVYAAQQQSLTVEQQPESKSNA